MVLRRCPNYYGRSVNMIRGQPWCQPSLTAQEFETDWRTYNGVQDWVIDMIKELA